MTKRGASTLLFSAIGFTLVALSFAGWTVGTRAVAREVEALAAAPARSSPARHAALEPARAIELPADSPRELRTPLEPTRSEALHLRSLENALRSGTGAPTDWEALLAACADERGDADTKPLAARAVDASLALPERLAALELLRALHAAEAVELPPAQERELAEAALGGLEATTKAKAAAAALAAFGGESARAQLYAELEQDTDRARASIALHGLRECGRARVLDEIGARLAQNPSPAAEKRLAAAAQGVARALGQVRGARAPTRAQADPLLALAQRDGVAPVARRRLLLAVASLGVAESESALCDLACDSATGAELALEAANALRASPRPEAVALLDQRLATSRLADDRRTSLAATSDFLRARDLQARR